ncbi:hypothetical protein QAD02_002578 [Eretmocerus hayati]|uniref:Uncharacterized protein n=1 Tax=Eretmocerus hayati TaxID=131215 RepID=A0ACC2NJ83_9HYME|nr:hypothetical protein QAD02_002578 [Eretmocerus hayati]
MSHVNSQTTEENRRERERVERTEKQVPKEAALGDPETDVTSKPGSQLRSIIVRQERYLSVLHNSKPSHVIIIVGWPRRRTALSDSATRVSSFEPRGEDRYLVDECYWSGSETSSGCDCSDLEGPVPSPVAILERNKFRLQFDVPATCLPIRILTNPVPPEAQILAPRPPARETTSERLRAPRSGSAALRDPRSSGKAKRRLRYLAQFGYLPTANQQKEGIISEISLREAIADFQTFAGINVTGSGQYILERLEGL